MRTRQNLKAVVVLAVACSAVLGGGCTVVSANRTFPKLSWYWSADAQEQRRENRAERESRKNVSLPAATAAGP